MACLTPHPYPPSPGKLLIPCSFLSWGLCARKGRNRDGISFDAPISLPSLGHMWIWEKSGLNKLMPQSYHPKSPRKQQRRPKKIHQEPIFRPSRIHQFTILFCNFDATLDFATILVYSCPIPGVFLPYSRLIFALFFSIVAETLDFATIWERGWSSCLPHCHLVGK